MDSALIFANFFYSCKRDLQMREDYLRWDCDLRRPRLPQYFHRPSAPRRTSSLLVFAYPQLGRNSFGVLMVISRIMLITGILIQSCLGLVLTTSKPGCLSKAFASNFNCANKRKDGCGYICQSFEELAFHSQSLQQIKGLIYLAFGPFAPTIAQ